MNFSISLRSRARIARVVFFLACVVPPAASRGQLYLGSGHIDLNVAHSAAPAGDAETGFGLYAHHVSALAGGATVDEPVARAVFHLPDAGGKYPTAGGILPFLGQSGQPVWLIPQNSPPATVPWVGFGGYGLAGTSDAPAADLEVFDPIPALTGSATAPAVRVRFVSALAPDGADFALWQTGSGGAINLYFSNRAASSAPQVFGLRSGQHIHFNWGFSQPGYYRVRLRLEGSIGGVAVESREFPVDFAVGELPLYEQWRRAGSRFTEAERADHAVGGPAADPDGDGRPNLLEYAFGAEPRLADAATGEPALSLSTDADAATRTPELGFRRLADPLLVYRVDASADLAAWTEIWSGTRAQNLAGPVSVPAPAPLSVAEPRRFLRLRASLVD